MDTTIVNYLSYHSSLSPNSVAITYLDEKIREKYSVSYSELEKLVFAAAIDIMSRTAQGQRVVLMMPSGFELAVLILACVAAGTIAVPVHSVSSHKKEKWNKVISIIKSSEPSLLVTFETNTDCVSDYIIERFPNLSVNSLSSDWIRRLFEEDIGKYKERYCELALIQYTSGSTGDPKGVMISHSNVLANMRSIEKEFGHDSNTVFCSWLPLHHDMGLIGNLFQPIYLGIHLVLMAPTSFSKNPISWLLAISRYGVTTSGAPNFAYEILASRCDINPRELDLSSWKVAYIGAEPIRASTLQLFIEKYQAAGFSRKAIYPCFGLAEATLFVCGADVEAEFTCGRFLKEKLFSGEGIRDSVDHFETADYKLLVSSGSLNSDTEVRIVCPQSMMELSEGGIGEIWISGKNISPGYWGLKEVSSCVFNNFLPGCDRKFMRTGDLGFIDKGNLYITDRLKDTVIIRGVNICPQDIELASHSSGDFTITDGSAAFSLLKDGEEHLIVVQEVSRRIKDPSRYKVVIGCILNSVVKSCGVRPSVIVLIRESSLSKTSSGKIQRRLTKEKYISGGLSVKYIYEDCKNGFEDARSI